MSSHETNGEQVRERKERFMALLNPVRHRLAHFARAMANDYDDAQDLISDTVLAAYERFDQLRDPQAFLGFLFTIAARIHKRRRWRGRIFGTYDPDAAASMHDRGMQPDISADVRNLYDALARLPERQREALALFEISGLSLEEIRGIQGGSISAVKMRLVRGRKQLAQLLGVPEPDATSTGRADAIDAGRAGAPPEGIAPRMAYMEAHANG
jgi:RNA polymerase sigma-70 factor (ECF subfamily)